MAIRAHRLDRLIDIQRKSVAQDNYGQEIETWTSLASRVAASYASLRAEERFAAVQFVAREQAEFWIRWDPALATLSPVDRLVYPAFAAAESPAEDPPAHTVWDIMGAIEIGREDAVRIRAARRTEQ